MAASPSRRGFLLGASAVVLAGCSRGEPSRGAQPGSAQAPAARYVFANAATAPSLDPALTDNVETNRVARQVLDGLVAPDSLTGEPVPALAESWKASADGLTLDFALRRDVVFHDGIADILRPLHHPPLRNRVAHGRHHDRHRFAPNCRCEKWPQCRGSA